MLAQPGLVSSSPLAAGNSHGPELSGLQHSKLAMASAVNGTVRLRLVFVGPRRPR